MDIVELLAEDGVVLRTGVSSKRQALNALATLAAEQFGVEETRTVEALLEREALGSTGLGGGVAVPHARIEGLERVCGLFIRLDQPVAWASVDERPVDLIFGLFAPPRDGAEHLRALAAVSRFLRSAERREQLRAAGSADEILALLVDAAAARAA